MLSDKDVFHEIISLCGNISNYLREENTLELDLNVIQKKTDVRNLIMILINIYRIILLALIRGIKPHSFLGEIIINDTQKLKRLIKIFLALAKGLSNNINIRNSLKGMIYSIDKFDEIGIPGLDFSS